jgi:hypothetical protein
LGVGIKATYKDYTRDPVPYLRALLDDPNLKRKAEQISRQISEEPNFGSALAGMRETLVASARAVGTGSGRALR